MRSQLRDMWADKLGFRLPFFIALVAALMMAPGFFIGHTEWQIVINNTFGM
tara:strand:+ start:265 stop:417 length:153 start_codon:yes stop_codon:yes gene_type:complete